MKICAFTLGLCLAFLYQEVLSKIISQKDQTNDEANHNMDNEIYEQEKHMSEDIFKDPNLLKNPFSEIKNTQQDIDVFEKDIHPPQKADCDCRNGKCVEEGGKYVCKCSPEYGYLTKTYCKACECGPDSNCTFKHGQWFKAIKNCICKLGYREESEKCVGPCTNNPCKNGGICIDINNGYTCECPEGYSGKDCFEKVSPCSSNPCKNGGKCTNSGGSFKCECMKPYSGKTCEMSPCSKNPCQNNGICKVEGQNFKCDCKAPFSGKNCENDPCSSYPCRNQGKCKIKGSTFECECPYNFIGDKCQHDCYCKNGKCRITVDDNVLCECQPEYGKYNNICEACNCGTGANCTWESGFLKDFKYCLCPGGQRLEEKHCEDICETNPCKNGGTCISVGSSFECKCLESYFGEKCEKDPCTDNPCGNRGSCRVVGNSFNCNCKKPYFGDKCENDPCTANPCRNGGTCNVEKNSFKCNCQAPFSGNYCEIDLCNPNPCQNGGICFPGARGYKCHCKSPFSGRNCEMDPCTGSPCQNGGTCVQTGYSFKCKCRFPYTGDVCQDTAICSENPCYNGGTCEPDGDFYKCRCLFPYFGENCEEEWIGSTPVVETDSTNDTSEEYRWTTNESSEFPETFNSTTEIYIWTSNDPSEFPEISNETTNTYLWTTNSSEFPNIFNDTTDPYIWTTNESSKFTDDYNTTYNPSNFTVDFNVSLYEIKNFTDSYILTTINPGICVDNSDCSNKGICERKNNQYYCDCLPNFAGERCEINLLCQKLQPACLAMGATCRSSGVSAICDCPKEKRHNPRSGLCENICHPTRCLHGTCEIIERSYKCNCDKGYTGYHCNERLNDTSGRLWFLVLTFLVTFIYLLLITVIIFICRIRK